MSKQLEWAKAYIAKFEDSRDKDGSLTLTGPYSELWDLAQAIIADAEKQGILTQPEPEKRT